jgi:hypothetical protein
MSILQPVTSCIDIKKLARILKPGHRITGNPQDETRGAPLTPLVRATGMVSKSGNIL